jgi:hypothetical protein
VVPVEEEEEEEGDYFEAGLTCAQILSLHLHFL